MAYLGSHTGHGADHTARLLISCPDGPGIVAAVSHFLFEQGANIVSSDQYSTHPEQGTFFMRSAFYLPAIEGGFPGMPASQVAAYAAVGGYYKAPIIHWQYTLNAAVFYSYQKYTVKFSVYNVTDRHNLTNDIPFYGNDFLTRQPPRSYDVSFTGKF